MSQDILHFLQEALRLKRMIRSGWIYSGVSKADVESVADHSYSVTLLSLLLAINEQTKGTSIDLQKVLIMAVLHDLPEAITQDIDRRVRKYSPKKYDNFKKELDSNAFDHIIELLPNEYQKFVTPVFKEFLLMESIEAKIVKEADRLETILQLKEYMKLGYPKENFPEFFDNFNDEANNYQFDLVKDLVNKILENEQ